MKTLLSVIIIFLIYIMLMLNGHHAYVTNACNHKGKDVPITNVKAAGELEAPAVYMLEMNVSAYCPCEKCCGIYADGITESGWPADGYLVAAPAWMEFGTELRIPGYADGEVVVVMDRGGAIRDNKLDLFFPTHQEALNWGRQTLMVEVGR